MCGRKPVPGIVATLVVVLPTNALSQAASETSVSCHTRSATDRTLYFNMTHDALRLCSLSMRNACCALPADDDKGGPGKSGWQRQLGDYTVGSGKVPNDLMCASVRVTAGLVNGTVFFHRQFIKACIFSVTVSAQRNKENHHE